MIKFRLKAGTQTIGHKLLRLCRRQTIDRGIDIGCTHTSEHHLLHVFEVDLIVVQIFSESAVE